jgi:uncharacterized membrane protein YhaH (DUF805 family)
MIEAVKTCYSKYFTFSGRARRSEYWWFFLFVIVAGVVASVIDGLVFGPTVETMTLTTDGGATATATDYGSGPIASVVGLVNFIPLLAVGWRRMHDTGRSGLLYILPTLVVIGGIAISILVASIAPGRGGFAILPLLAIVASFVAFLVVIWWLTRPSDPGPNAYGPEPVP